MAGHVWPASPAALIAPTDHAVRLRAPPGFVAIGSVLTPVGWSALIPAGLGYRNEIVALTAICQQALVTTSSLPLPRSMRG